jgi:hypothetical protein
MLFYLNKNYIILNRSKSKKEDNYFYVFLVEKSIFLNNSKTINNPDIIIRNFRKEENTGGLLAKRDKSFIIFLF